MLFLLEVTQFKGIIRRLSNYKLRDNTPDLVHEHHTHQAANVNYMTNVINNLNDNSNNIKSILSATNILNINWLPIDPRMFSFTPHQIALYIYDKYIDENADLCIYRYFADITQQSNNASVHEIEFNEDLIDENHELVKLYKVYDQAFTEIWRLLQTDSFLRFKSYVNVLYVYMSYIKIFVTHIQQQRNFKDSFLYYFRKKQVQQIKVSLKWLTRK